MNEFLKVLGISVGFSGAFLAAVIYVLKKYFGFALNKELEKAKSLLTQDRQNFQSKLDHELETYKNELNRLSSEFNIKLTSVQLKRIEVIEKLYEKLVLLHSAAEDYTAPMHEVIKDADAEYQERAKRVDELFRDFKQFYYPRQIYFNQSLCDRINAVCKIYFDSLWAFGFAQYWLKTSSIDKEMAKKLVEDLDKHGDKIRNDIAPIIKEIGDELRIVIGTDH